ncbi:hypothetical protein M758_8G060100 [Ceratodon purpureus]|nr:hypothetical protein M758_8G060100 [Ceratodon purpureus]
MRRAAPMSFVTLLDVSLCIRIAFTKCDQSACSFCFKISKSAAATHSHSITSTSKW